MNIPQIPDRPPMKIINAGDVPKVVWIAVSVAVLMVVVACFFVSK